jgi:hypothetical protein
MVLKVGHFAEKIRKTWEVLNVLLERMEKISWTNHVKNEEVLQQVKEERNNLQIIQRRKAKWIGHIVYRNCLLKHVIEGKREGWK